MMLGLRGADERFFDACERVLGLRPPTTPNTVAAAADGAIFWLGPDEWLYDGEQMVTVADLRPALLSSSSSTQMVVCNEGRLLFGCFRVRASSSSCSLRS